ncbi:MAG: hypothetical protein P8Y65_07190 [Campylobacterales bacterium]|jgi:hypothetical protein
MISAVLTERVELLCFFVCLNTVTLVVTIHWGPTRWLMHPFETHLKKWLGVPEAYARSYAMTAVTERFEILLRLIFASIAIALYFCCPLLTWLFAVGMGIFMLISTFFGFCLSALGFIAARAVRERCRVRR